MIEPTAQSAVQRTRLRWPSTATAAYALVALMRAKRSFGPFIFDQDHGLLAVEGRTAALSGRGALILETLLDASGEIVTKSALLERAWPGATVEEGNLAVWVATLRKCMGTLSPDGREWISTIPRIGYRVLQPAEPIFARTQQPSARPAIAVLPFDNLSAEAGQDYFADGIVEELTTALSRFRTFSVVARASAFAFRDSKADIPAVVETLGVRYILDGSVRRAGAECASRPISLMHRQVSTSGPTALRATLPIFSMSRTAPPK